MEIDPTTLSQQNLYKLIIGTVVPRPIAWVSTQDENGLRNLAPFSFFNALGSNPPALMISVNYTGARAQGRKDTLHNILETGEFVVNIVTEATAAAMNDTATDYPAEVDEFAAAGLTPVPSHTVRPPRVAESPVHFECVLHTSLPLGEGQGSTTLVVGVIKHMHLRDDLLDDKGRVDIHRLQPVGRLAGNSYCYVRETFDLVRKTLK
ncbi:MAG: flavin reductase family protein [Chloroflexaceae bacterium]|jgi:flavin reductase (DIM6/NTAB) family NADH-FMN oxidoreductase RutF|nr:flavin reductase family protein [Chloroflexaceae bacterium]